MQSVITSAPLPEIKNMAYGLHLEFSLLGTTEVLSFTFATTKVIELIFL